MPTSTGTMTPSVKGDNHNPDGESTRVSVTLQKYLPVVRAEQTYCRGPVRPAYPPLPVWCAVPHQPALHCALPRLVANIKLPSHPTVDVCVLHSRSRCNSRHSKLIPGI